MCDRRPRVPVSLFERSTQSIPPALGQVVMACLAKDPAARPRDADKLGDRLAARVPGEPWTSALAEAWWREQAVRV